MTKPTHSLTPEQERAINETLCRFMEWRLDNQGAIVYRFLQTKTTIESQNFLPVPTRSLDTLRLVEERLTGEEWLEYVMRVCAKKLAVIEADSAIYCVFAFAKSPVSLRAAALKEVVGECKN